MNMYCASQLHGTDRDKTGAGPPDLQMLYTDMERRYEDDGEARAAARAAAEEDLLMNHTPDVRELPAVLEVDLDASHDAGVLSVQCCPGEGRHDVITGSGEPNGWRHLTRCTMLLSAQRGL